MNIFGTSNSLIGPIALIVGGACFLGGAILRKGLNEFNIKFSVIGCTALGSGAYIIASNLIAMKWALLVAIIGFGIGGFALSFIAGESSGEGGESIEGNYEE